MSMGFSRKEYWSGLPFSPPGDLLTEGPNPYLLHWQVDFSPLSHLGSPLLSLQMFKYLPIMYNTLALNKQCYSLFQNIQRHPTICYLFPLCTVIFRVVQVDIFSSISGHTIFFSCSVACFIYATNISKKLQNTQMERTQKPQFLGVYSVYIV